MSGWMFTRFTRREVRGGLKSFFFRKTSIAVQQYDLFERADTGCCELTGELGLPLAEALLLHGVEVRQIVVFVFQRLLVQAERGQSPGGISAGEHAVGALCHPTRDRRGKSTTQRGQHENVMQCWQKEMTWRNRQKDMQCIWCSLKKTNWELFQNKHGFHNR